VDARFIAPASRRHQIVHVLREAIIHGEYAPGQQVRQEQVSAAFGVSPTPVREALRQLESEGLVVHRPHRGVFVAETSTTELFEVLIPLRLTLERYALCRSGASLAPATRSELARLVAAMEDAARRDDFAAATDADVAFHELCVVQAGDPFVITLWHAVHSRLRLELHRFASKMGAGDVPGQHRQLLEVLSAGDAGAIADALEIHIVEMTRELFEGGDSSSTAGRRRSPARVPDRGQADR
jgi:DNA-binding GntR family transcriptional regulator